MTNIPTDGVNWFRGHSIAVCAVFVILSQALTIGKLQAEQILLPLEDSGMSTYYASVFVEGVGEGSYMVDTGAGYMIINSKILEQLKQRRLATFERNITGVMADGSETAVPIYTISRVSLGQQCHYHDVEVAVMPGETRCILGMSLLRRAAPFTMVTDPPGLIIGQCGDTVTMLGPDLP